MNAVSYTHLGRDVDAAVLVGSGEGELVVVLIDGAADSAEAVVAVGQDVEMCIRDRTDIV